GELGCFLIHRCPPQVTAFSVVRGRNGWPSAPRVAGPKIVPLKGSWSTIYKDLLRNEPMNSQDWCVSDTVRELLGPAWAWTRAWTSQSGHKARVARFGG